MKKTKLEQVRITIQVPGKLIAKKKEQMLRSNILNIKVKPVLKVIQVGNDPASTLYTNLKVELANTLGIDAERISFDNLEDNLDLIKLIQQYNHDNNVHGIMIQSPIQGMNLEQSLKVFNTIVPEKDVDGLTYGSLGKLWQMKKFSDLYPEEEDKNQSIFLSATPAGVIDCLLWIGLHRSNEWKANDDILNKFINLTNTERIKILNNLLEGKSVLVINRSNIVGKPLAALLEMCNSTVTIAHSKTKNLDELISSSDIVFTATGISHYFKLNQFQNQEIVVDIGINNSTPEEKVKGDIEFSSEIISMEDQGGNLEKKNALYFASVPGGVGPLTVINLLENTYKSCVNMTA